MGGEAVADGAGVGAGVEGTAVAAKLMVTRHCTVLTTLSFSMPLKVNDIS